MGVRERRNRADSAGKTGEQLHRALRPRVSLRCGPWNAHAECPGEVCDCPCHEEPRADRQR
jgi:hypothetical protein